MLYSFISIYKEENHDISKVINFNLFVNIYVISKKGKQYQICDIIDYVQ